jgi:hypothetical protein
MRSSQQDGLKCHSESIVQPSSRKSKFQLQAFAVAVAMFLLGTVAFLPQVSAGTLATDPNALQKIKEFIYKPKPDDLVIKPQGHEAEEAA